MSDQLVEDEDKAHCAGIFSHTNWGQAKELEVCMGCGCVGVASCSSCYYNAKQKHPGRKKVQGQSEAALQIGMCD